MAKLKAIFMGSDCFSLPALIQTHQQAVLLAVVTQPDKPRGRGLRCEACEVKRTAVEWGVPVLQPASLKSEAVQQQFRDLQPDVIVTAAYGKLVPDAILALPPLGCINIHPSLLPKYRGASPIEQTLLNGDSVTGITVFYMDAGWDTGDIIMQKTLPVAAEDNAGTLRFKLAHFGAEVLREVLPLLQSGKAERKPQNHDRASYAPMLQKNQGMLDWKHNAEELNNRVRGFTPRPGAFAGFRGKAVKILKCAILDSASGAQEPGTIVQLNKHSGVAVQTASGALALLEVQPEGRKVMSGADFINGFHPRVGERFDSG